MQLHGSNKEPLIEDLYRKLRDASVVPQEFFKQWNIFIGNIIKASQLPQERLDQIPQHDLIKKFLLRTRHDSNILKGLHHVVNIEARPWTCRALLEQDMLNYNNLTPERRERAITLTWEVYQDKLNTTIWRFKFSDPDNVRARCAASLERVAATARRLEGFDPERVYTLWVKNAPSDSLYDWIVGPPKNPALYHKVLAASKLNPDANKSAAPEVS